MEFNKASAKFISILHKEHSKYINETLKDEGLSFGLTPLLAMIYENEGINQEKLAEALYLNESTITRNLKKLEDEELIERIKDKRKKIMKVTPKGEKLALKILDYEYQWDEKLKKCLTNEEYDNFLKNLKKICEKLI
ncbi:MAG: MarR family winged helix-turn-helix transcriptional regulator [Methanobrevibacter sp.]|uniref:MarR family winged helix-turn-helix transcriptional regulator n=1 Tax=Methanobrevibacter sp. TaxID=66852 RepID=UPI003F05B3AA